jgi:hypothetical protein
MMWRCSARLVALSAVTSGCVTAGRGACVGSDATSALRHWRAATDSAADALPRARDSTATVLRARLRDAVDQTMQLDACGALVSVAQLRDAAMLALVAAGAGAPSLEQSYDWARRAVMLDRTDRGAWGVLAASWDQLQVRQHLAQWFATVITCAPGSDGRCELEPLDTSRVSDAQRVELGLRTLVQQQQRVDSLNKARKR